ncbi:hypothetical protein BJX70DRAFT_399651 [Aspergillus crustosus]
MDQQTQQNGGTFNIGTPETDAGIDSTTSQEPGTLETTTVAPTFVTTTQDGAGGATGTAVQPTTEDDEPAATGLTTTTAEPTAIGTVEPSTTSTTQTSANVTEIAIFPLAFPNPTFLHNHAGSISTVGPEQETTIVFDCTLGPSQTCGQEEPQIILATGPSMLEFTYSYDISRENPPYSATITNIVSCDMAIGAACYGTGIEWTSTNSATTTTTIFTSTSYAVAEVTYSPISISDGLAKLTDAPGPAETTDPENPDDGDGGGSKAWIAGPVVGCIVGIALVAGLIWFLMKRRRRQKPMDDAISVVEELGRSDVKDYKEKHTSELPVREVATAELPAVERRGRESGVVHELP